MPATSLYIAFVALDHATKVRSNCTLKVLVWLCSPLDGVSIVTFLVERIMFMVRLMFAVDQ